MIFHQLFDDASSTYTYLLAKSRGSDAIIIDPVLEHVDDYLKILGENQLRLIKVIETHLHADHFTGMSKLRRLTGCITCAHENNQAEKLSQRLCDGDIIEVDGIKLRVLYTPGHTDDSICLYDENLNRVFTGDTLFIRGNGRTDFQHGDPGNLYDSIKSKLFSLPASTNIYPGHDYKGEHLSSIAIEKLENQRMLNKSRDEFIHIMVNLNLPRPSMMDVVVPANMLVGSTVSTDHKPPSSLTCEDLNELLEPNNHIELALIDLREPAEINQQGTIAGSQNITYQVLEEALSNTGKINQFLNDDKKVVFFCAYGERSALALDKIEAAHKHLCFHLKDGLHAWKSKGFPTD